MSVYMDCPSCKTRTQVARIVAEDGGARLTCALCGHTETFVLPPEKTAFPPQPASSPQPATPSGDVCPKCAAPRRPEDRACPRCGLMYALWKPPEKPFARFAELGERWEAIRMQPASGPEHDRFLEACFKAGALADAARVYKELAPLDPQGASARLRQVELLSQMHFTPDRPSPRWGKWVLWVFMVLLLAAALYLLSITPEDLMP